MARRQHLRQRKGGGWEYRRRWPNDIRHAAGTEFFTKGLGTRDFSVAERKKPAADDEFYRAVDSHRRQLDTAPRSLSIREAETLASTWYRGKYDALNREHRATRLNEYERQERLARWQDYGVGGGPFDVDDLGNIQALAGKVLAEAGITIAPEGDGYGTLCNLIEDGLRELAIQGNLLSLQQLYRGPEDAILRAAIEADHKGKPRRTLGELIEAHRADKEAGWSQSAKAAYKPVHRLLRDSMGASRELSTLGRGEGRYLFDLVKVLPANLGKLKSLRELSVPEAVERGKVLGLPTISPKTINDTYMGNLAAIFRWGVAEGWLDANPVEGLRVVDPVADARKRDPFSMEHLETIFGAAPWSPKDDSKPGAYWAPVLALYHGFRLAEVSGLLIEDVTELDGYPVMLIRPHGQRRLKNDPSRRVMPIHPEVQRMGFVEYASGRAENTAEGDLLFPDVRSKGRGQIGYNIGRDFNARLKELGVTGNNLSFHSFRHTWEDRLREAGLHGQPLGRALGGRSGGGGTDTSYGSGFPTATLVDAIGRIAYLVVRI